MVHAVVNQKHVGYLVALIAYGVIVFPSTFGLEHHLLIYGSGPRWTYSDMRGFGPSLGPWLWFKLYWAAWALLLAVAANAAVGARHRAQSMVAAPVGAPSFHASDGRRGRDGGGAHPHRWAVSSSTTPTCCNRVPSPRPSETERRAEYERRYGKYAGVAQPTLASTNLRVEIYPERREAEIRGTYVLANTSSAAIDSIHVTTVPGVETGAVSVDRPASPVLVDDDLGYRIYALEKPLQPGDSLHLSFEVHFEPHGFRNNGADAFVVAERHATSRIGIGCRPSAISGIASSMVPEFEGSMDSPDGPPFHRSTTPRRAGSESAATRSPSRRSWGRAGIRSRLRRGRSAARGRKAADATSITSRMYPSTISTVCSPPGTRCTKNSGIPRRAQGRPSRFRSSITLGMPRIWAAWWRAYAPRSITTPGSLVPTRTAISG